MQRDLRIQFVFVFQKPDLQEPREIQAEEDDDDSADPSQPFLYRIRRVRENAVQQNAEHRKDDRKTDDEEQTIQKYLQSFFPAGHIFGRCATEVCQKSRNDRENARRQKRNDAGEECYDDRDIKHLIIRCSIIIPEGGAGGIRATSKKTRHFTGYFRLIHSCRGRPTPYRSLFHHG